MLQVLFFCVAETVGTVTHTGSCILERRGQQEAGVMDRATDLNSLH